MLPDLSLIFGGADSGKSAFAEKLVLATGRKPVYIATAEAHDAEMEEKISRHRARREEHWRVVETPHNAAGALAGVGADEVALLDCATLWLSNQTLAGSDIAAEKARLFEALAACNGLVVVVSNEIGLGIVPEHAPARHFRAEHGRLNQGLAARAGFVAFIAAGLPLVLKGSVPAARP